MKKSVLQKKIWEHLEPARFQKLRDGVYFADCGDRVTRLLLRLPDLTRGFTVAAQFRDFGPFSDKFSDSVMKQYDFENTLGFASRREYSDEEIAKATGEVVSGLSDYLERGKAAIRERIDEWTFGDFDERVRNDVLVYMGLPGIDPYSADYIAEKAADLRRGGVITVDLDEYNRHKDSYDEYRRRHCKLEIDPKDRLVRITYDYSGQSPS